MGKERVGRERLVVVARGRGDKLLWAVCANTGKASGAPAQIMCANKTMLSGT